MSLVWTAAGLVALPLLLEFILSTRNEQRLRARGAIEPPGDVWPAMAVTYPAAFLAMVIEGTMRGGPASALFAAGLIVWTASKALKYAAISALGDRWSFRVLVLPGQPLVSRGPYRWFRHPNYIAVAGELIGAGIMLAAPLAGVIFTLLFVEIMRRRIRVEERALGLPRT